MSSLDDPRVLFAAERTLLAWQRTALALMDTPRAGLRPARPPRGSRKLGAARRFLESLGFVVERFGLFLRMVSGQPLSPAQRGFSLWLGVGLLVMGAVVALVSALQFRTVVRGLGAQEIPRGYWTNFGVWLNLLLGAVALALAVHFVASA